MLTHSIHDCIDGCSNTSVCSFPEKAGKYGLFVAPLLFL